jgi:hypothetical protein
MCLVARGHTNRKGVLMKIKKHDGKPKKNKSMRRRPKKLLEEKELS